MEKMEEKKPSYEELEKMLEQRSYQLNAIYQELQNEQYSRACNTLSFYFEVLKNAAYFPVEYIDKVVAEIQVMLPVSKEETDSEVEVK